MRRFQWYFQPSLWAHYSSRIADCPAISMREILAHIMVSSRYSATYMIDDMISKFQERRSKDVTDLEIMMHVKS
jgi:hypothetical protein